MRILGCCPVWNDSPLDALWVELARRHDMTWAGKGREIPPEGGVLLGPDEDDYFDLILMADPARPDSSWWEVRGFAGVRASVWLDSWNVNEPSPSGYIAWARKQRLDLLYLRVEQDVARIQEWLPDTKVCWLPFGFDPGVFHDKGLPRDMDVAMFGHFSHHYPVRHKAREILREHFGEAFYDFTIPGDVHPTVTGHEYATLLNRCKVVVNTSGVVEIGDRTYRPANQKYLEIPACRAAMVCTDADSFGLEVARFKDDCESLPGIVETLLNDERLRRGSAAYAYSSVHAHCTVARSADRVEDDVRVLQEGRR